MKIKFKGHSITDCEVEDINTRKDVMYQWIHCAFAEGYRMGCYLSKDTNAGLEE